MVVGRLKRFDATVAKWKYCWSAPAFREAIAIVFFWFGKLKVLAISPGRELVSATMYLVPAELFVPILGV